MGSKEVMEAIEPAAVDMNWLKPDECALYSIAISMRRIADALNECNDYGEVGGKAFARAIRDGLRP
jgi:hypothetical protein